MGGRRQSDMSPLCRFCRINPNTRFCQGKDRVLEWVNILDLHGSCDKADPMPKPVPIPVRQKIWERAAQGESAASLALAFDLPPRTVRHLLKRARERGNPGLLPGYRAPSTPDHAYPGEVRKAVLASRRDHPSWGAQLIRVMLVRDRPEVAWPSSQTTLS